MPKACAALFSFFIIVIIVIIAVARAIASYFTYEETCSSEWTVVVRKIEAIGVRERIGSFSIERKKKWNTRIIEKFWRLNADIGIFYLRRADKNVIRYVTIRYLL